MTTGENAESQPSPQVTDAQVQPSPKAKVCVRCPVCNQLLQPEQIASCPTCHTDNTSWSELGVLDHISHFPVWLTAVIAAIGIILYLVLLAAGVILLVGAFWSGRDAPAPGQTLLPTLGGHGGVLLLCILIAAVIYISRHSLRHYELRRQTTPDGGRPSLGVVGVTLIILAVAAVIAILLGRQVLTGGELTFAGVRNSPGVFWIVYAILLPCVLLVAMLFGVKGYLQSLDERYARPACCDPLLLCAIAKAEIEKSYLGLRDVNPPSNSPSHVPAPFKKQKDPVEIVSSKRNSLGGLDLVIRHTCDKWEYDSETGVYRCTSEFKIYEATTDQWGKVQIFGERSPKQRTPGKS